MKKVLIVVDMQNDFIDGSLGTPEAVSIIPNVVKEIENFDGEVIATMDTHYEDYLDSHEGEKLPTPHCIKGSDGWKINADVKAALEKKNFVTLEKLTFGSIDLPEMIYELLGEEDLSIELIGLCTDISVISNALTIKAFFPESEIYVNSSCCAGMTPEHHEAALKTMKSCLLNII